MHPQEQLRQASAECLDIARTTTDQNARARLLSLAERFMKLASGTPSDEVLGQLLDEFNDGQMRKR
jgi:hypothetical protein